MTVGEAELLRREHWAQTPATRIRSWEEGAALIDRAGIVTLYSASPEIPNLYYAYMGDANAKADSSHDSPSGEVYTWRWALGGSDAAFYSSIVRRRPTWVSWPLVSSVLRLLAEQRTPDELVDLGVISGDAYRIAQVLEEAVQPVSTGDLRREADFPMGKEQRTTYLKAIDELEGLLLLAKVFVPGETDMRHVLTAVRYREYTDAAERMSRESALDVLLRTYLPVAVYANPRVLARHLRLDERELVAALDRLVAEGLATRGDDSPFYRWTETE